MLYRVDEFNVIDVECRVCLCCGERFFAPRTIELQLCKKCYGVVLRGRSKMTEEQINEWLIRYLNQHKELLCVREEISLLLNSFAVCLTTELLERICK